MHEPLLRIAYQGEPGAYSEEAARRVRSEGSVRPVPCDTFEGVFDAVSAGRCERGIVPIENSLAGSVLKNYDLLLERDLRVVGESYLRIRHYLMALPGVEAPDVCTVLSHPQALSQCESSLRELLPEASHRAVADTAGSARLLVEEDRRDAAAIASERAARVHGLRILRRGIEDDPGNRTRFLLLGRELAEPGDDAKTSLAFSGPNEPGLLARCLSVFARRDIDLTKIESRPLRGSAWEYVFHLDFRGRADRGPGREALSQLEQIAGMLRVFGSYPRGEIGTHSGGES